MEDNHTTMRVIVIDKVTIYSNASQGPLHQCCVYLEELDCTCLRLNSIMFHVQIACWQQLHSHVKPY